MKADFRSSPEKNGIIVCLRPPTGRFLRITAFSLLVFIQYGVLIKKLLKKLIKKFSCQNPRLFPI